MAQQPEVGTNNESSSNAATRHRPAVICTSALILTISGSVPSIARFVLATGCTTHVRASRRVQHPCSISHCSRTYRPSSRAPAVGETTYLCGVCISRHVLCRSICCKHRGLCAVHTAIADAVNTAGHHLQPATQLRHIRKPS